MFHNYKNAPNWVSSIRIFLIPVIAFFLVSSTYASSLLAIVFFVVAGVTDYFDGWMARKYGHVSTLGKFLDPIADKLLVSSMLIVLLELDRVSIWLVLPLILRDILIDGMRSVAASEQIIISAGKMGKWKTAIQMGAIPFLFLTDPWIFPSYIFDLARAVLWLSLVFSLASAMEYIVLYVKNSKEL